jgi:hypothetical protein
MFTGQQKRVALMTQKNIFSVINEAVRRHLMNLETLGVTSTGGFLLLGV